MSFLKKLMIFILFFYINLIKVYIKQFFFLNYNLIFQIKIVKINEIEKSLDMQEKYKDYLNN